MSIDRNLRSKNDFIINFDPVQLLKFSEHFPDVKHYVDSKVKHIFNRTDYLKLFKENDELSILYPKYTEWFDSRCLYLACKYNLLSVIKWVTTNDRFKELDWNAGLRGACKGGHQDIVQGMIDKGAKDWIGGFVCACCYGNQDIVELMIEKGANNWNLGLFGACRGGHQEIVQLMITMGATDWNGGLYAACEHGHKEIVELMIKKGANNWNQGLHNACRKGHQEIIELMIKQGATD